MVKPGADIAKWNGLDNPNVIEVDQVLRVVPPSADTSGRTMAAARASGKFFSQFRSQLSTGIFFDNIACSSQCTCFCRQHLQQLNLFLATTTWFCMATSWSGFVWF
jgi:hypothetical protein